MKTKIYTPTSLKIFTVLLAVLIPLVAAGANETDAAVEFVARPNGTLVDTRVPEQAADVIIRHFEAVENGDIAAFRRTLISQDAQDIIGHAMLIMESFAGLLDIKQEPPGLLFPNGEISEELAYKLFVGEIPARPRNEGIFVKEIRLKDGDYSWQSLIATVTNSKSEEKSYWIILDEWRYGPLINSRKEIER